ncbi:MAG: enamine deaminase RidA [Gemmatimonadales bacterium]|nr:MAG: enamine deaminase RidA [Gemmatimonadales bacterium]
MSYEIVNPAGLGVPRGYNHGMLASREGRVLFVAGQTAGGEPKGDFVGQWARALRRVVEVVRAAGGEPRHIGRLTIYVTDMSAYRSNLEAIGDAYRSIMGKHYPAMTLVEVGSLVEPDAMVEIEATAVIP